MLSHKTTYRVIYGDTDNMGVTYHANYLRWFEIGRTELLRSWGLSYKTIEEKGIMLPISEAQCKYVSPTRYDELVTIEARLDTGIKGGIKFTYRILNEDETQVHAEGFTKHACLNGNGKVVRPPSFLVQRINEMANMNS